MSLPVRVWYAPGNCYWCRDGNTTSAGPIRLEGRISLHAGARLSLLLQGILTFGYKGSHFPTILRMKPAPRRAERDEEPGSLMTLLNHCVNHPGICPTLGFQLHGIKNSPSVEVSLSQGFHYQ